MPTISGQSPLFDFGNSPLGTITVLGVGGIQGAFGYSSTPTGDELIADYGNNRSLIVSQ